MSARARTLPCLLAAALAAGVAWGPLAAQAQARPALPSTTVHFKPGASSSTLKGQLKGPDNDGHDYVLRAAAGQTLRVRMTGASSSTAFNVLPPDGAEALFNSDLAGTRDWRGVLPASGDYRVRVYLNRAAARQGKASGYTLQLAVSGAPSGK